MQDFKQLKVWQKAHQLTLAVYRATESLPREELYGLTSQIRRSCTSIPANIAEGCGKSGDREFARFLQISMGSSSELEYHILLAHDLGFLGDSEYEKLESEIVEVKRMLTGLIKTLKATR